MSSTQPVPGDRQLPRGHLLVLNRSFRRTLEAENKSPRTIEAYTDAVRLLATYCQAHGQPLLTGELKRQHIQCFIADHLARWKPAAAHNRYRGLHAFFKWAVTEGDLEASPMEGMKPPQLPSNRWRWLGLSIWLGSSRPARGGTLPAPATPPSSCSWWTPECAGPSALA
jgi:Phage integrase, N-terminal SAM-like domain